ncbi:MAG: extracellular solute-binding protein [Chloroflexi bacterium]|nr:extracellular solute-binding protein [Chloroflexota bacterium]
MSGISRLSRQQPILSRRRMLSAALISPVAAACSPLRFGGSESAGSTAVSGRVVLWFSPTPWPFNEDVGGEFVQEFEARYPQIKIAGEHYTGSIVEKLRVSAAGGTLPDLAVGVPPHTSVSLGLDGILAPVDQYLKTSRAVKPADIWPSLLADMTYKGKQYAMPFAPDVRVNYVNSAVLAGAGLNSAKPASTWDEMEDHVRRIYRPGTDARLGYTPFWGSGGTGVWLVPFWQLGGELTSADGEKVTIDNEKGIQALEWLKRIHDMQGGWDSMQEVRQRQPRSNAHFINGTMGYYYATHAERKNSDFLNNPSLQFGFADWPLPKGGKPANYGGDPSLALTAGSKVPEAAWRFLEFLAEERQSLRFAVRYDRIPIRIKTAESQAYHQNDPFLKLAVEGMRGRKWHIGAPGGADIVGMHNPMVVDVMSGKRSVRDALKETQTQMQQVLDKNRRG